MLKLFIAGDKFVEPETMKNVLEEAFQGKYELEIDTVKFDFPVEQFPLEDDTCVPSGMSWEDPAIEKPDCGIREFYGEPDALSGKLQGVDVLIVHGVAVPRTVLAEADRLKAIVVLRGGPVNIDHDYVKEKGIEIFNTNGKNAEGVAEFTVGLLLSFLRNIPESSHYLKNNVWKTGYYEFDRTGVEIRGKTFGLIGFGRIARNLAQILKGFSAEVIAYDPFVEDEVYEQYGVRKGSFEEVLAQADFVSLHARKPKGSGRLLDGEKLALLKPNAVLINTARGDLVDYPALKTLLEQKRIRGAVLDVYGDEPFSFYKQLLALPNVLGTPHIAGGSQETVGRAYKMTIEFLDSFIRKQ